MRYFRDLVVLVLFLAASLSPHGEETQAPTGGSQGLEFIDTGFENASPLWYDVADGVVRINLLYDHERSSPNRAAGHIHFLLHAQARLEAHVRIQEPGQRLERPAGVGGR